MTKHDEKLLEERICGKCPHNGNCDTCIFLNDGADTIKQIKDAGFIHKSEVVLDEGRIAKIIFMNEDGTEEAWQEMMKAIKHDGDCTNECHTCSVCLKEHYFLLAHAIAQAGGKITK